MQEEAWWEVLRKQAAKGNNGVVYVYLSKPEVWVEAINTGVGISYHKWGEEVLERG